MAEGVVDDLEVVEVEEQHDRDQPGGVGRLEALGHALGEERPVGEPGQGVVVGLVLELLLESRQRAERLLQLAVLERDGRMAGERLEQLEIVGVERAEVAQAVRDEDRSDQARLADERRVHRVAEATSPSSDDVLGSPWATRKARRSATHCTSFGIVERGPDRLHHVDRLARPDARPQDVLALDLGQERDLGDLGPEHLASVVEQGHEGPVHLRAALQDPGGLVQHLEAFVLLALRDVRAIGDEDRDDRHREQQRGGRLDEQDRDHEQREAGVRERHDFAHHQHARDPGVLRRTLGEGDRGGHGEDARPCSRRRSPGRPSANRAARSSR